MQLFDSNACFGMDMVNHECVNHENFIDSVLYGKPVNFGLEEGRQLTELMENAYIADKEHRDVIFG